MRKSGFYTNDELFLMLGNIIAGFKDRLEKLEEYVSSDKDDYIAHKKRFNAFMSLVRKSNPRQKRKACDLSDDENPVWMSKIKKWCPSKSFARHVRVTTDENFEGDSEEVQFPLPLSMFKEYPGDLFTTS